MENKDLFILFTQCQYCLCPSNARSQGISSHGIDQVNFECSGFSIKRVGQCFGQLWLINILCVYSFLIVKNHDAKYLNSLKPGDTFMHQWTGSSLVQVMACHLCTASRLPELMLMWCQLDAWKQNFREIWIKIYMVFFFKSVENISQFEVSLFAVKEVLIPVGFMWLET